jgi:putative membrane protein
MLTPSLQKNDAKAKWLIGIFSVVVFAVVSVLGRYNLAGKVDFSFDVHIFAKANAIINAVVSLLLIAGLYFVKQKKYELHKNIMLAAMMLSVLFLVSYICHHLFAGETKFGDTDHNGIVSPDEKSLAGSLRVVYYFILGTHIPLAGIILPFILFTSYRSLTGDYAKHKKLARFTFPIWMYVAITGVLVYLLISPYYY